MDSRGYGSGYSGWGGPSSRGPGGFDQFGGGSGFGGHMKRTSMLSSTGAHADAVIAKINERLDMLSQLEGGLKGDRYDQYESMDSRTSMASSRDLYRSSSYGYGDGRGDNMLLAHRGGFGGGMGLSSGAGFEGYSPYGVAKMRHNVRDSFVVGQGGGSGGWASAGRRSPRRGAGGRGAAGGFGGRRSEPSPIGGGGRVGHRGHSPGGGRGKLPSLLSNRMYPESGGFHQGSGQGPHDFPGRHFGGGPRAGRQRGRKRPLNKQVKPQRDGQKKRKQTLSEGDEPESKINKTGDDAAPEQTDNNGHEADSKTAEETPATEADDNESKEEDSGQGKKKPQGRQPPAQGPERHQRMRKRRGFLERVMFACSVCKFRSFYKEDMEAHLASRFHKDHFKFLSSQLTKPTTDFLQEYLQNKFTKMEQRVSQLENHCASICQVYKEQDLTRDLGMEHFMKKVEAAHCAACDLFIPMQLHLIQKHLKSPDHNYNRKAMMEQSKRASLSVARSILNHKLIGKKLESYLKGENPFVGNQDEQEPDDSMVMELSGEQADSQTAEGTLLPSEGLEGGLLPSEALEGGLLPSEALEGGLLPSEALESGLLPSEELEGGLLPSEELEGAQLCSEELEGAQLCSEELEGAEEGDGAEPEEEGFELGEEEDGVCVVHDAVDEGPDLERESTAEAQDNTTV